MARSMLASVQPLMLDALPGTAAVVDSSGKIVAVNDRWMSFGLSQGAAAAAVDVGADYFAACRAGGDDANAQAAQVGLRAVLDGQKDSFELTYPCHTPKVQRWFRLSATPVEVDGRLFALVLHINMTEMELRLRLLTEVTGVALLELDPAGNLVYATSAWSTMVPADGADTATGSRSWLDAFDPADAQTIGAELDAAISNNRPILVHARLRAAASAPDAAHGIAPTSKRVRIECSPQMSSGLLTGFAVTVVEPLVGPTPTASSGLDALRDSLTRLANRAGLVAATGNAPLTANDSLLCLDLDAFKCVNDQAGHPAGDEVLRAVAARIRHSLRGSDLAARVGGDEFVVILRDIGPAATQTQAEQLIDTIGKPIHAGGAIWTVGASIGMARPAQDEPLGTSIDQADAALLVAKSTGGNRAVWFTDVETPSPKPSMVPPGTLFGHYRWHTAGHLMAFPGSDRELADEVARYLIEGFAEGDAGLVVATDAHTGQILERLEHFGVDPRALRASGQLVVLDATAVVAGFMSEGVPDPHLFHASMGGRVRQLLDAWPHVRAYGELIAVLWSAGNLLGAFKVEDLLNELTDELPLLLVCAYQAPTVA